VGKGRYRGVTRKGNRFGWHTPSGGPGVLGHRRQRKGRPIPCDVCDRVIQQGDDYVALNGFLQFSLCLKCAADTKLPDDAQFECGCWFSEVGFQRHPPFDGEACCPVHLKPYGRHPPRRLMPEGARL